MKADTLDIVHGDCIVVMQEMEPASIDAIITDPPYEIGFMGKKWDASGVAFRKETWEECLRVLKPGGHMLVFGFSRNYHRLACAIEDAGFEVRDCIMWIYGNGFPKSHNVSKAIDKSAGVSFSKSPASGVGFMGPDGPNGYNPTKHRLTLTGSSTPDAQQWKGWGTALKPAYEPIIVARKPLGGTVAANVLEHGVGGINIDGCRVGTGGQRSWASPLGGIWRTGISPTSELVPATQGRWPANIILDEEAGEMLDRQSGQSTSRAGKPRASAETGSFLSGLNAVGAEHNDTGGASRFFYCPKASKKERDAGLEDLEEKRGGPEQLSAAARDGVGEQRMIMRRNTHPTVKPLKLCQYLCRLITPPSGLVLDPFMGSGSTGVAAIVEGFRFIGVEQNEDYCAIASRRMSEAALGAVA